MTDYMLTVITNNGARDIQVNNGESIHEAIRLTEKETGCRVDHGRSNVGSRFDPALIIDASTGQVYRMHDKVASESMMVHQNVKVSVARGT